MPYVEAPHRRISTSERPRPKATATYKSVAHPVLGAADHAGQTLPVECRLYLTMEDVMARSDLVIHLIAAQRRGDGGIGEDRELTTWLAEDEARSVDYPPPSLFA